MNEKNTFFETHFRKLYWLLIAAAAILYGVLTLDKSVWSDEAYTFALISHNVKELWQITAADVHPPLYYLLLKLCIFPFGYSMFAAKVFSAVCYLLILIFGGKLLRELFGGKTAILFMGIFLMYPYSMGYVVEVRMYSLAALFLFLNAVYGYRCWKWNRAGDWAIFALAGTAAALTHYFALVSAAVVYGLLLLTILCGKRELWKHWLLASAATILLYLPWLGSFVAQLAFKVSNDYWIEPITLRTVISYVLDVFGTRSFATYPLFLGGAFFAALLALLQRKKKADILLELAVLAIPLGTLVIGLAASILVRPVFIIRYLLPCMPLIAFFLAYALDGVSSEALISCVLTVVVIGGINNYVYFVNSAIKRPANALDDRFVNLASDAEAYVVPCDMDLHISHVLSYYEGTKPIFISDPIRPDNPHVNRFNMAEFDPAQYRCIAVLVNPGESVDEDLLMGYQSEFIGTFSEAGKLTDAYLLQK